MYEVYPTQTCLVALRCAAKMAEAASELELAARWRSDADRIQAGMLRLLRVGDITAPEWRVSFNSVLPSLMDCLAPAFLSQYCDGLDPNGWDKEMSRTTRNTLRRQLAQRSGQHRSFMGDGIGWLTHSALILDEMDDASKLLSNIAKYTYDKNMDYADDQRGIDWRKWAWIVPEGVNLLPDGSWYRLSDLSNGANQGPVMHALEACLGIDDTDPAHIKILPRLPHPLAGLDVDNLAIVIAHEGKTELARLSYTWRPGISFEAQKRPPPANA